MQTSPPHDPRPPSNPGPSAEPARANTCSAEPSAPPILAPPPPPPPAHLLAPPPAPPPAPPAVLDMDLEDGFSMISDDELEVGVSLLTAIRLDQKSGRVCALTSQELPGVRSEMAD